MCVSREAGMSRRKRGGGEVGGVVSKRRKEDEQSNCIKPHHNDNNPHNFSAIVFISIDDRLHRATAVVTRQSSQDTRRAIHYIK